VRTSTPTKTTTRRRITSDRNGRGFGPSPSFDGIGHSGAEADLEGESVLGIQALGLASTG
jgi:hypothetical protein